jgi:hypothetical protein
LLGREQIKDTIKVYKDWGLEENELWSVLLSNPILFHNYPYEVMPKKRRLFRYFKFTR